MSHRSLNDVVPAGIQLLIISCGGGDSDGLTGPADLARVGAVGLTASPKSLALAGQPVALPAN